MSVKLLNILKKILFYACSVVTKIIDTTKLLKSFPLAGKILPEEKNEFVREHLIYSYRIIYEIKNNFVYVLAAVHGRRLLYPEFNSRIKNTI